MGDLDEQEAFLKAIFDAPDDDLPRLVFADWLDERGDHPWAEMIRLQCRLWREYEAEGVPTEQRAVRQKRVLEAARPHIAPADALTARRGFRHCTRIEVPADLLNDPAEFRRTALVERPEWYGAEELKVTSGVVAGAKQVAALLTSPVTQRVTRLDLGGEVVEGASAPIEGGYAVLDFVYRPRATVQAVVAMAAARECRRLVRLDLRHNDLDNDAARALLHSPHLGRLRELLLFDGNRLRGRTWAQLRERFGEEVVQ